MALDLTISFKPPGSYIQGSDVTVVVTLRGLPDGSTPTVSVLARDPEHAIWLPPVSPGAGPAQFLAVVDTGLSDPGGWLVEARATVNGDEVRRQQWFTVRPSVGPGVFVDGVDGGSAATAGGSVLNGGVA